MRRFSVFILASSILVFCGSKAKANEFLDYDFIGFSTTDIPGSTSNFDSKPLKDGFKQIYVYLVNSNTNAIIKVSGQTPTSFTPNYPYEFDRETNKLYVRVSNDIHTKAHTAVLDITTNTWSTECKTDNGIQLYRAATSKSKHQKPHR